jgi:Trm5-related predicted tRNA methylase
MKDKKEIQYHQSKMEAYGVLRHYIFDNHLAGTFYTNNGEFMFRTDSLIYAINNCKEGFYIATYTAKK